MFDHFGLATGEEDESGECETFSPRSSLSGTSNSIQWSPSRLAVQLLMIPSECI